MSNTSACTLFIRQRDKCFSGTELTSLLVNNSCKASTVTVPLKSTVKAPFSSFKQTRGLRGSCKCLDKHQNVPLLYRQQSLAASSFPSAVFHSAVEEHSYVRALASSNNLYKQKFQQRLLLARLLGKSSPCLIIIEFIDRVHTVCTYKEFCELLPRLQYKINTQVVKYHVENVQSSKQHKQQKSFSTALLIACIPNVLESVF